MLLSDDHIRKIHAASVAARLVDQREALFAHIHKSFAASIPRSSSPVAQLLLDLHRLNEMTELTDGSVPFETWLSEAVLLTTGMPERAQFEAALDEVRGARRDGGKAPGDARRPPDRAAAQPRRHFLDEAPFDLSRPEAQSLLALLEQNLYRAHDTVDALDRAGVLKGRIDLEAPSRARWRSALESAANQGRARRLVDAIAADPEWEALRGRLTELLGDSPAGEVGPGRIQWKGREPTRGFERSTGKKSRLVDVAFLATGVSRAKSVVRVDAYFGGESLTGTGFFIAPGRVLTNHHVLFRDAAQADRVTLWLDFELRPDGSVPVPQTLEIGAPAIQGAADHDWATLEVPDAKARSVAVLGLGTKQTVQIGDYASIIQHPHGLPKKLGIFGSEVRFVDKDVIQYLTDTEEGSSGAPVFNDRWEVVALHHMWTSADKPDGGQEIRNEGVHIDRVVEALRRRDLLP